MKDTLSIILAGGKLSTFPVLTDERAKSAMPFGGIYRIIDFSLSNLVNSGAKHTGIIVQYLHSSLMDHVGNGSSWDLTGHGRQLKFLPPYVGATGVQHYVGTADALYKNISFIVDYPSKEDILVLSGDHVYQFDFTPLINQHREKNADATLLVKRVPPRGKFLNMFAFTRVSDTGRVTLFEEKPRVPSGDFISIGVYIFKKKVLREILEADQADKTSLHMIAGDVIPRMIKRYNVYQFVTDSPWFYLGDVNDYYKQMMSMLAVKPVIDPEKWDIRTNLDDRETGYRPPAHFYDRGLAENSIIGVGCIINGRVVNSILSPGVRIEKNSVVENSIIMHDTVIKGRSSIKNVICDKDCTVGENVSVGDSQSENIPNVWYPELLNKGITLIGKGIDIPPGTRIGRNVVIFPKTGSSHINGKIPSGTCPGRGN